MTFVFLYHTAQQAAVVEVAVGIVVGIVVVVVVIFANHCRSAGQLHWLAAPHSELVQVGQAEKV